MVRRAIKGPKEVPSHPLHNAVPVKLLFLAAGAIGGALAMLDIWTYAQKSGAKFPTRIKW